MGASGCVLIPCSFQLVNDWYPPDERGRTMTFGFNFGNIGTTISFVLTPILMKYLGWQYVFYMYGGVGMIYSLVFLSLSTEHPNLSTTIHEEEKNFINSTMYEKLLVGQVQERHELQEKDNDKASASLACESLTAIPVLAAYVCVFCGAWSLYTQWNYATLYLHSVLGVNLENAGMYQVLPTLLGFFLSQSGAFIIERLSSSDRPILNRLHARRLVFAVAYIAEALFFALMGYIDNLNVAVFFYIMGAALTPVSIPTYYISVSDLAPYHAGPLMSIANGLGAISAIVGPIITGVLLDAGGCVNNPSDGQTQPESCLIAWKYVFFLTAGLLVLAVFVFGTIGTTTPQIGKSGYLLKTEAYQNSKANVTSSNGES